MSLIIGVAACVSALLSQQVAAKKEIDLALDNALKDVDCRLFMRKG